MTDKPPIQDPNVKPEGYVAGDGCVGSAGGEQDNDMTDNRKRVDPNGEPPGNEPPTSAKELLERHAQGEEDHGGHWRGFHASAGIAPVLMSSRTMRWKGHRSIGRHGSPHCKQSRSECARS